MNTRGEMKYKIRNSFFETNSSSVHALCCAGNNNVSSLDQLQKIRTDGFGWDYNVLKSPEKKASYIFSLILDAGKSTDLIEFLNAINKEVNFETYGDCYVDHGYEKYDKFIPKIREIGYLNFILNDCYYIILDNDNSDMGNIEANEPFIIEKAGN